MDPGWGGAEFPTGGGLPSPPPLAPALGLIVFPVMTVTNKVTNITNQKQYIPIGRPAYNMSMINALLRPGK